MTHPLFDKHRATLEGALERHRHPWLLVGLPGDAQPQALRRNGAGRRQARLRCHLGKPFELGQPGQSGWHGGESSPYGVALDVSYPVCDPEALIAAGLEAMKGWQAVGADGRTGICLEILDRLNKQQLRARPRGDDDHRPGLDDGLPGRRPARPGSRPRGRGLRLARAELRAGRGRSGKSRRARTRPLVMKKHFQIVGRGVGLVVGCGTFPTWNTYPGLFAALATGNAVIVKPHSNAILPAAITVRTVRAVLAENGIDPNLVSLCVTDQRSHHAGAGHPPGGQSVDFTGGNAFGQWLIDNCRQAQVYAELAGVNNIVIDSTDAYKAMLRNLAFTLSLYSGQMCTTSQAIFVPAAASKRRRPQVLRRGLRRPGARRRQASCPSPKWPTPYWAPSSPPIRWSASKRPASGAGKVVLAPRSWKPRNFPNAEVRTPVLLACDAADEAAYMEERFGPISFIVKVADTAAAIARSERVVSDPRRADRRPVLDEAGSDRRHDRPPGAARLRCRSTSPVASSLTSRRPTPTTTAPAATRRPTPRTLIRPSSPTASASCSAGITFEWSRPFDTPAAPATQGERRPLRSW
jgi:hypothetical protein